LTNKEKHVTIILLLWWSLARGNHVVPSRWQATIRLDSSIQNATVPGVSVAEAVSVGRVGASCSASAHSSVARFGREAG